ncbi:hypothetical protein [Acidithiobacillus ferriphilus]|uniref:hypothetical protein n=1 Tax=Acidithiobacillus ferriphilus TaxID=1689834 RepID=UPI001C06BD6F|nr:hypothetical protein [Acidithiobacillus ferriphilus]MBU2831905.1 hypothetical protein [Acidithiobacillus ferriphilus]
MDMKNLRVIKNTLGINKFDIFVMRNESVSSIGFGERLGRAIAKHYEESEGQAPARIYVQQNNEARLIFQSDGARIGDRP